MAVWPPHTAEAFAKQYLRDHPDLGDTDEILRVLLLASASSDRGADALVTASPVLIDPAHRGPGTKRRTPGALLFSDDYGSSVERKAGLKCYGKGMYGDVLVWVCRRVCVELAVTELKALTWDSASPIAVAAAYVGELPYRSTTRAGCPQAVDE